MVEKTDDFRLTEKVVRDEFRMRWRGWMETYEPRAGGGSGVPDVQILIDGMLLPIELKRGKLVGRKLTVDKVRPAQVSWHVRFHQAGGQSCFLIGALLGGKIRLFVTQALVMVSKRRLGLHLGVECFLLPISSSAKKSGDLIFTRAFEDFFKKGLFKNEI